MPRVNVFLDERLHRRLKVLAAYSDSTMQQKVQELVDGQLKDDLKLIRRLTGKGGS